MRGTRSSSGRRRRRKKKKTYNAPRNLDVCPICEQSIRDVLTAIIVSADGAAAHFDCVVRKLTDQESLGPKEKVCYVGGGEFAVVRFNSSDQRRFSIQKRIRYELKEHNPDWRKDISEQVSQ